MPRTAQTPTHMRLKPRIRLRPNPEAVSRAKRSRAKVIDIGGDVASSLEAGSDEAAQLKEQLANKESLPVELVKELEGLHAERAEVLGKIRAAEAANAETAEEPKAPTATAQVGAPHQTDQWLVLPATLSAEQWRALSSLAMAAGVQVR